MATPTEIIRKLPPDRFANLLAASPKSFREDLFHRIDVVHLELPPLRTRGRDVLELAQTFVWQTGHEIAPFRQSQRAPD